LFFDSVFYLLGSLVAFAKLDNRMDSRPLNLPAKNLINLSAAGATLASGMKKEKEQGRNEGEREREIED